jgi:hypothetical protein
VVLIFMRIHQAEGFAALLLASLRVMDGRGMEFVDGHPGSKRPPLLNKRDCRVRPSARLSPPLEPCSFQILIGQLHRSGTDVEELASGAEVGQGRAGGRIAKQTRRQKMKFKYKLNWSRAEVQIPDN